MTRAEILDCLTDRPCEVCKFHESGRCERWDCVFEEQTDEMTREDAIAKLKNFADHCQPNEEFLMAIKSLSAEPCEDCISRRAARKIILDEFEGWPTDEEVAQLKRLTKQIDDLPSVTPKQKMGRWLKVDDEEPIAYDCSECGAMVSRRYRFCPDCGAKMVELQEGSEKE